MNIKKIVLVFVGLLITVVIWGVGQTLPVAGQHPDNTLQSLLTEYQVNTRSDSYPPLIIRLVQPLQPGEDISIFIPTRTDVEGYPLYSIASVGADHVCLEATRDTGVTLSCIPFTNIAVIREVTQF